jgi:hypothetical protein
LLSEVEKICVTAVLASKDTLLNIQLIVKTNLVKNEQSKNKNVTQGVEKRLKSVTYYLNGPF